MTPQIAGDRRFASVSITNVIATALACALPLALLGLSSRNVRAQELWVQEQGHVPTQDVGQLPLAWQTQPPVASSIAPGSVPLQGPAWDPQNTLMWWNQGVSQTLLTRPNWVRFDLNTVLMDALQHSPRIQSLKRGSSMALERIVQQDAAFDPTVLLSANAGRTNDPVGNTLTTGGAERLREESISVSGGVRRNGRRGTEVGLTQELGTLDSNSSFFVPRDQGTARLSLSLTQPLLARGGKVYNERLLMQARIDSRITWQDMRSDVESRIAETMEAYWRLYETRCHLIQQKELLARGTRIETLVRARGSLDSGRIELAKAKQRISRRTDQLIILQAEVQKRQTRLATLIGSEQLLGTHAALELIPVQSPVFPHQNWQLRDVMVQALENRPEIKSATSQLESAALAIQVTRTELVPQLNAVVNASLAALNGNDRVARSFFDEFRFSPGINAGLEYEMPRGRRFAKSRHREAYHQYQQRSQDLREAIQETQFEVEAALIDVKRTAQQHQSKRDLLTTALEEERILAQRWELMGGDGSRVGVVLENLLDAQQRRADAEREYVTAQTSYMVSLIDIQRAMGTLLIYEGINSVRHGCSEVDFVRDQAIAAAHQANAAAHIEYHNGAPGYARLPLESTVVGQQVVGQQVVGQQAPVANGTASQGTAIPGVTVHGARPVSSRTLTNPANTPARRVSSESFRTPSEWPSQRKPLSVRPAASRIASPPEIPAYQSTVNDRFTAPSDWGQGNVQVPPGLPTSHFGEPSPQPRQATVPSYHLPTPFPRVQ